MVNRSYRIDAHRTQPAQDGFHPCAVESMLPGNEERP